VDGGGLVTGAACVLLVSRQHWANWPIGNLNAAAFLALFWLNGLYADGALQILGRSNNTPRHNGAQTERAATPDLRSDLNAGAGNGESHRPRTRRA
jgi:hypothetical protein